MFRFSPIRRYAADRRGNTAMMTALMMGVVVMGVGAALDYSLMSTQSNDFQNMADAAVLAAARTGEDDVAKLQKVAKQVVDNHNTTGKKLEVKTRLDGDVVVVDIYAGYEPVMKGLFGEESKGISVTAASPLPTVTPINIALVLDTTDSMQGENMSAMQRASNALLTELEKAESETRVSIVPFGEYVNIGYRPKATDTRTWIDRMNEGEEYTACWNRWNTIEKPTCKKNGTYEQDIWRDGRFMGTQTRTRWKCEGGKKEKERVCQDRTRKWNGCMGTREDDTLARQADYGTTKLPAAIDISCGTEIMPLSTNFLQMRAKVTSLKTRGATYLPGGLAWGWRTLDKDLPYTEAKTSTDPNTLTAMLFMTDGVNNRSRGDWSSGTTGVKHRHTKDGGAAGLELTRDLCEAIKADGIALFVVAYQVPGAGDTATVLSDCATDRDSFFQPENSNDLIKAFQDVAKMLNRTRLVYHEG